MLTGNDFVGLFPSYLWIDVEASSLSSASWPLEFGWCSADLRAQSLLIKPHERWTEWSLISESIHNVPLETLFAEGIEPEVAARKINATCAGCQVLSDNPESDQGWLSQLFQDTGIAQQFTLNDGRQLEAMAAAMSRLSPGDAHGYIERINGVFPHPHRAGPDVRREAARFLVMALPHEWEEILAMA